MMIDPARNCELRGEGLYNGGEEGRSKSTQLSFREEKKINSSKFSEGKKRKKKKKLSTANLNT
jgi:hypothetical protein